jgi:alanine racemase
MTVAGIEAARLKSWIEVSQERLMDNFRAVAEVAGAETQVLAVVKANAYGHGAEVCSVALARAGARWLGVADAKEGSRLRRALDAAAVDRERAGILVLCGLMPGDVAVDLALVVEYGLTLVVWTLEQLKWLHGHTGMRVHVEVDTGMGRQGARPGAELDELLSAIAEAGLKLDGVMTHFSAAEVAHSESTHAQERRFEEAIAQVRVKGMSLRWVHAGNSSSVDNPAHEGSWLPELAKSVGAGAMVRSGIALYGYCLPIQQSWHQKPDGYVDVQLHPKLLPVMTWKTYVLDVREMAAGDSIGYNGTFRAKHAMRVALLPVGYSDGLRRDLSGSDARPGGWVMLHGHAAAIVGRISMNLTTVDVSGISGVQTGDEVVLLGDGITADDHARLAGTISYEILCGVREG